MRGTIQMGFGLALVIAGAWPVLPEPAASQEVLLRCATSAALTAPGHHPQRFAQRHLYAPARNAMFFSHTESACRWKAAQHRRS